MDFMRLLSDPKLLFPRPLMKVISETLTCACASVRYKVYLDHIGRAWPWWKKLMSSADLQRLQR